MNKIKLILTDGWVLFGGLFVFTNMLIVMKTKNNLSGAYFINYFYLTIFYIIENYYYNEIKKYFLKNIFNKK